MEQLPKGVWEQLDYSNFKFIIYDENGQPKGVSHEEYIKFFNDYSPEILRRKVLGYSKSIGRVTKLFKEVLGKMQEDSNVNYINDLK